MTLKKEYDIVILGAGLAGLALCRQLLLDGSRKSILLVDNHADLPGKKQKVGESLVQAAGYYFARVLDLEEHLLQEHYPKYNLRFHWKTPGRENRVLEDYGFSYIRTISNVGTYQLDRNKLEEHLLEVNLKADNVTLCNPVAALKVGLSESENGPHRVSFNLEEQPHEISAGWVIDTTGRSQMVKRKLMLAKQSPIDHGSSWCWVEGLVNIERLTALSYKEIRTRRDRQKQGLFPMWLATNHFCGEGFWFWVIPLHGKTSLGVVYDKATFPADQVSTPEKLIAWVCREFPLFAEDLPSRRIVDAARFAEYAYDCGQTISASKWAMSGMSGRFSDPLYSPGSDLIAIYNTLIVDAIREDDPEQLRRKCELYESLMNVLYQAYVPSYAISYDVLGDQEVFTLKYGWELAVYFAFYAFPFINDLFTDRAFIPHFFRKFSLLGPINRNLQHFLSGYYQWKKQKGIRLRQTVNDFKEATPLKTAEMTYYQVASGASEGESRLDDHLTNLKEYARFIAAYVASMVLQDRRVLLNRSFVESIKLRDLRFDPEEIRMRYAVHSGCTEAYPWTLDPLVMEKFRDAICLERADMTTPMAPSSRDMAPVGEPC